MNNIDYKKCYLSEVGHNNFFYPTSVTALISKNCDYTILPWIGGKEKNLTPIKISKSCIVPINFGTPDNVKGSTVVWVDENFIVP
tara:strand:+ start:443 stop:697 length:255 start_codon:yes stop_codon:yes gene_type:complete